MVKFIANNLQQTQNLAAKIAKQLQIGSCICLVGDLGAGKTELTRAIINALNNEPVTVASPTYNIVLTYDLPQFTLWHFDLYRIEAEAELYEIGIEDALNTGVSIIEWPQIAANLLPKNRVDINIKTINNTREFEITGIDL